MLLFIILLPTMLAVAVFAAAMPYRSMRAAIRNARAEDGSWKPHRLAAESRSFRRFTVRAHVIPLGVLAVVQFSLVVLLEISGAGSVMADLFGEFHPEVALHARDLDELSLWAQEVYEARSQNATLRSVLGDRWPLWPAYLVLTSAGLVVFVRTRLVKLTARYAAGVRSREREARAARRTHAIRS